MRLFDGVFDPASLWLAAEILVKLGIGVLLAGAIGWEREKHGRPAGIRTHMLVVLGVILFTEVSRNFGPGDPGRIAAQIVTGIGFLGAGTILRLGAEIKGLTTAASIWASAGIGMAVSTGGPFLIVAVVATILALFTLAVVDNFERKIAPQSHKRVCQVELSSIEDVAELVDSIPTSGGKLEGLRIASREPILVNLTVLGDPDKLLAGITRLRSVKAANWSEAAID